MDNFSARNGHAGLSIKDQRRQHQDGRVYQERDAERHRGVYGVKADAALDRGVVLLKFAALHQRRVQVQIVGHHGGADDPDGNHQHARLSQLRVNHRRAHFPKARARLREHKDFDEVAHTHRGHEKQDDGLDGSHPEALQAEQKQHVAARDDDRPEQRNSEKKIQSHRAAQHFRQVTGADGELAEKPVGLARPSGIPVSAALGEIFSGHHAQAGGDDLHEDGHQAGKANHPEEPVFELRSGREVRAPVARVHVADADQNGRPDKSSPLVPEARLRRGHLDAAVHPLERKAGAGRDFRCLPGRVVFHFSVRVTPGIGFGFFHEFALRRIEPDGAFLPGVAKAESTVQIRPGQAAAGV